ncbi:hypothetical protein GEMRC1_012661 [Eukaryota sp. GEM-RC1]
MSHYLCDICHEILKNPVTTWCGHTFCMSDLQEWLVSHDGCPICRAEVDKSRLCPNYKLKEAVEAFVAGQGESICIECDEAVATCYCAECDADLCDQCFKDIHRPKLLRTHVAIPLQKKHASIVPKCPIHPSKSFDLFCTSCSVALCSICAILGDHDQHKKNLLPFDEGRSAVEHGINAINQELAVAVETVGKCTENALQQAASGFAQMKETLTDMLQETMLDSVTIMNDLKSGKPVIFKPKIGENFITTTSTLLNNQSAIISSLNEELCSIHSEASRRLASLSVVSESNVASARLLDDTPSPIKSITSVCPVQQVEEKELVIDWNELSSKLKNCYDEMVRNEVSTIYLDNNSIGNEGAIAIAEALKVNSSVSTINLYNNSIGPEGAIAIAESLKVNSSVSEIYLWDNSIGNEGAIAIAEALKVNSSVSTINLQNNSIGPEGAIAIAEALKVNSSVSTINLYNNSIGPEGAIAIAESLKVNSSVSEIYLWDNSIGNEGAIAIAEALKVNSSVSTIYLGNNSIGNEGAIAIAEALKVNSSVSEIYLAANSIGNEGAIAIAEALKVNASVSQIYLYNNSINSQTQQSLKSLHKNRMDF